MVFSASSGSSPASCSSSPSQPIQIGFNPISRARSDTTTSFEASSYSSSTSNFSVASTASTASSGPSPYGSSCLQRSAPSSYFSDAELFGDEQVPYLDEAPAPPRGAEAWLAQARAQGHAPPSTYKRPIAIPIQGRNTRMNGRASLSSMPSGCSAD
ncbi:hypothetical protein AAFC00_006894 [Neodothiora populina]|uniref:Uncharacterized protein n=1 Tax=Neodothiora populina TaxID=2781224 RepID=A0ABR3PBL8_9PEZI